MKFILFVDVIAVGIEDLSYRIESHEATNLRNTISSRLEFACNIFFSVETILEILSKGLILEKGTYLRSKWNILNIIVIISR